MRRARVSPALRGVVDIADQRQTDGAADRAGGLLDGVVVLDLSRVLAGPYAGSLLAEMGADVIKVESPDGDPARGIGPFVNGRSLYFSALNSGKRGVVLDLTAADDRARLDRLCGQVDILLENYRPSTSRKLGLNPTDLLVRHPHLCVVTISGYYSDSDRAEDAALDLSVQAESGIMSVTGRPGMGPIRAGVPIGDLSAGMLAALGAVSAHVRRLRTGRGSHIEIPLMDATLTLLSYVGTAALATGSDPGPVGSGHHSVVPYGGYPTRDGWIVLPVIGDKHWRRLGDALGLQELTARPELAENRGRLDHRKRVDAAIAARLSTLTSVETLQRLRSAGLPCAPVNGVLDALRAPYVRDRGTVHELHAPDDSRYHVVSTPLSQGRVPTPAPSLGEHTSEVLAELDTGLPGPRTA